MFVIPGRVTLQGTDQGVDLSGPIYGNHAIYVLQDATNFPQPGTNLELELRVQTQCLLVGHGQLLDIFRSSINDLIREKQFCNLESNACMVVIQSNLSTNTQKIVDTNYYQCSAIQTYLKSNISNEISKI